MAKSKKVGRPAGRNPVIAVRVEPPLQAEIAADAKASERTMAAEIDGLLRQALGHRKRLPPSSPAAQAIEAMTLAFVMTGDRYARDNKVTGDWWTDLESRRQAALAVCSVLIANFVSSDPEERGRTVAFLKSFVAPSGRKTISQYPIGIMEQHSKGGGQQ